MFMLFYLDPLQNYAIVMSPCMHNNFFGGREVKHLDESVLPVTKKEGKEGPSKKSINILLRS